MGSMDRDNGGVGTGYFLPGVECFRKWHRELGPGRGTVRWASLRVSRLLVAAVRGRVVMVMGYRRGYGRGGGRRDDGAVPPAPLLYSRTYLCASTILRLLASSPSSVLVRRGAKPLLRDPSGAVEGVDHWHSDLAGCGRDSRQQRPPTDNRPRPEMESRPHLQRGSRGVFPPYLSLPPLACP
jgi:hypothetical protein